MKFKVGDLCFYTSIIKIEPSEKDIKHEYIPFRQKHIRPFYLAEGLNAGIVLECHKSSEFFLKTNKNRNIYIWQSQQTGDQLLLFECELTSADDYATMRSYMHSFISPLRKKR